MSHEADDGGLNELPDILRVDEHEDDGLVAAAVKIANEARGSCSLSTFD